MAPYKDLSDADLVALLKADDEGALSAIYFRYWDKLFSIAGPLDSLEEAEECVQDIFFSLWQRRANLELTHSLHTYLSVAVKYRVIDRLDKRHRLRKRMETNLPEWDEPLTLPADAYLIERELMERIAASVSKLPEKCQIVFKLSREENKSNKEIAEELNISEKTVEGHISRAIKGIRGDLATGLPIAFVALIEKHWL